MFREIDTKDIVAVQGEVESIYLAEFPKANPALLRESFGWAADCFAGRHPGYQAIDAKYHDLQHTLQVTLCYARLLQGYHRAKAQPPLTARAFELGIISILLHDTGYLKKTGDLAGTGAKYTLIHVGRSAEFAALLLHGKGFSDEDIRSVQNMIRCTGVNTDLSAIPFQNELEKRLGFALGTADLLGQMAAPDYIDKLGILYQEFEESNRFNGKVTGPGIFTSPEDLRNKTPSFWEKYVVPKINRDFLGLYQFLSRPTPEGPNAYIERIEENIARLQQQLAPLTSPSPA